MSEPWRLETGSGPEEEYQSIDPDVLHGRDTLRITYNLHGLNALEGDASAIIIDQDGWHYISLSNYGENGLDGEQVVDIPLADFPGLDLNQPVGTLHTRFWANGPYTVDIRSIAAYNSQAGTPFPLTATPANTATIIPSDTAIPTSAPTNTATIIPSDTAIPTLYTNEYGDTNTEADYFIQACRPVE